MGMPTYAKRLKHLTDEKLRYTQEKQRVVGYMDYDDHALILPPEDKRKLVQSISGSGMPINDVLFNNFEPTPTQQDGGFFGPLGQGRNFRDFLKAHPPFIDPMSALAGAYMVNFGSYRTGENPCMSDPELIELIKEQKEYQLVSGVFAGQHFCQELQIGLDLGWDGLIAKIEKHSALNDASHAEFYDGLLMVIDGFQSWMITNANEAKRMAEAEADPEIKAHLYHLHDMNTKLAHHKPDTFEEACQFMLWYQMGARSYNGSGSMGRLDVLLLPYYLREKAAGTLDDERAVFIIACTMLRDTAYLQLGGYDEQGYDTTNEVSYLILEAIHRLNLPSNVGVCVGAGIDRGLLRRSVELQFEDKNGNPRFVGMESLVKGLLRNPGVTDEMARMRTNSGCHWMAIPGREYSIMDCVKLHMGVCFDYGLRDAVKEFGQPTAAQILDGYRRHVARAVDILARGFAYHYDHQIKATPELVLDLMCYDVIERGLDASNGGVDYYLWCIDAVALAVVADSLAAIQKRVIEEKRYTFEQLLAFIDADWEGEDAARARLYFMNVDRYGRGGTQADQFAKEISEILTEEVKKARTPKYGHQMVPGIFSWANTIPMGKTLGATPNGRKAGMPISHGANPNPGFRQDGAATAMSNAIAAVQPGQGNTAPMQIELEPSITGEEGGVEMIMALIEDHFAQGGTLINMNVIDADKVREAHKDPSVYPDLVVRVTGFSAYFASLSPDFRQLVVDRILDREIS